MTRPHTRLTNGDPLVVPVELEVGEYETKADFLIAVASNLIADNVDDPFELMVVLEGVLFECIGQCKSNDSTDRHMMQTILRGLHRRLTEFRAMQRDSTIN